MKVLYLLAGPNGAGKTTFVDHVLRPVLGPSIEFVNADRMAHLTWPGDEERHAKEASQWAERRREEYVASGIPFIAETVFSHPSKIDFVAEAARRGYTVELKVILIPRSIVVARVETRVSNGGHTVPAERALARYDRLWGHVATATAVADRTDFYDNSSIDQPFRRIATLARGRPVGDPSWPSWTPAVLRALSPPPL